jgi:hypothetical protein
VEAGSSCPIHRPCQLLPPCITCHPYISFISSPLKLLWKVKASLAVIVLGWSPFKIVPESPWHHQFKMATITKNRIFFNYYFIWSQNEVELKLQLHDNELFNDSSSKFFCEFFFQSVYNDYTNKDYMYFDN